MMFGRKLILVSLEFHLLMHRIDPRLCSQHVPKKFVRR
ncbi:unnamed protein product [Brassica oleracea]|uniref:Uncharacterized protein n=1 Tax=Brassica oleracea TaxID=3712 RepID=A0A3P6BXX7_BRAOL|nr:unnamed protein product [Brassica oleracea]